MFGGERHWHHLHYVLNGDLMAVSSAMRQNLIFLNCFVVFGRELMTIFCRVVKVNASLCRCLVAL